MLLNTRHCERVNLLLGKVKRYLAKQSFTVDAKDCFGRPRNDEVYAVAVNFLRRLVSNNAKKSSVFR